MNKAVLRTLAYADVFDFPLTKEEIWRFLISSQPSKKENFQLKKLPHQGSYYFLPGREKIINLRKKRAVWSQQKLMIAKRVAQWLRLIPSIKMVGVTGALAMNNSPQTDDIDFLIITSKNRLWLTRLLTVLLVELIAFRRRPNEQRVKDKICLNMFLDEAHLKLPKKEQNLFTAHEVCQLRFLWDKNNLYKKFINQNSWYQKYLINWKP